MSFEKLPSDLIFEIFTRNPALKTLSTCKCVCKSWNKLIHEPKFMSLYCQRTGNLSGYYIYNKARCRSLTKFVSIDQSQQEKGDQSLLPDDCKILASCDQGIICCLRGMEYYACKPATQQWQILPCPDIDYNQTDAMAVMVMSSSPLRYKIVRLSKQGDEFEESTKRYKCEIFDSKTWTWKQTQDVILPPKESIPWSSTSVTVCNSIYWLTSHNNVLAFHESDGTFHKFQLPEEVMHGMEKYAYKHKKLVEHKGKLGLIICNIEEKGDTEIWVTFENSRNRLYWREKMVVDKDNIVKSMTHESYVGLYHDVIEFLKVFYDVELCQREDWWWSRMEMNYELTFAREFFRFRSDLEKVNLGKEGWVPFGLMMFTAVYVSLILLWYIGCFS